MASFLLIRHAESPWSDDDDRPLSAAGMRAAESLPERLKRFSVDAIYSSPYRRALQTASPLAERRGLRITALPGLRERALGSFSPASFAEAVASTWSDFDLVHPGGESSRDAQRRGVAALDELARRHPTERVALATHGNLLALVLNAFDPTVDFAFWRSLAFPDVFELRRLPSGCWVFHRVAEDAVAE